MSKTLKWLMPATAAVALLMGVSAMNARAADESKKTGSVAGTVVDKDGKGVEGVEVRLMKGMGRRPGGPGGGAPGARAAHDHGAIALQEGEKKPGEGPGGPGGRGGRGGAPVATATTDKDGKFEMKDVPAGEYLCGVRDEEKKVFGRAMVKVEEGKTAEVTIKTSDTPPQRGGGGGRPAPGGEK